ncbi:DUF4240 domain-containing protein [Bacillus sp. V59.32b]|uniref:DUF4240 domain-containing protein n=1 Tax=Bacillus sp. V59.32b TaxID=1758642 RepID=UPI000E3B75C9|nr:DUF4240 domain-containing protein [Bacillus sp. V59.32b]RFU69728.1 DUF4240 domain-containing protein [Bacillus sp. V59.32b]
MEILLIYQDGSSNKFWKINVLGSSYTVTYGKIGTVGNVKTKDFNSEENCLKEAEKLIQSKLKKGYTVSEYSGHIIKDSTMTEEYFWGLLEKAKNKGEDQEEQFEWLVTHLSKSPIKEIVRFDYIFNKHYKKSYTSDLWAAAYIVMGGCSDDSFDYFRAWLLYLGKDMYEEAIKDPESIIPHLEALEEEDMPDFEDILSLACLAYEEKTGLDPDDYYDLYTKLTDDAMLDSELELDWDEDDEERLRNKFPRLWEIYGENPLEH